MKHHAIAGGGGALLHLVETGDPRGRAVLFLHGFSQCSLAWARQLDSELAGGLRLVAMDLRGHGASDRPREGYDDTGLWAADVRAAIRELELDRPVLCGWSYGPLVILDYIRHHGESEIGGIHLVGALTTLGTEAALAALTPDFLALVPALLSTDAEESVRALESLLRLCVAREPSAAELYAMLGYNASVPPFVRQALLARSIDNDDVLATIRVPVLITHGAEDAVVRPAVVERHRAALPHARIHVMPSAGHAPFHDDAPAFNRRLAAFCEEVACGEAPHDAPRDHRRAHQELP